MEETINQRIVRFRKNANLTQTNVANALGMNLSTYAQMERMGKIHSEVIIKLCNILKVDELTLLYGDNRPINKVILDAENMAHKTINIVGISEFVTQNFYEKFCVLALRNLKEKDCKEIYEFILEKLKNLIK